MSLRTSLAGLATVVIVGGVSACTPGSSAGAARTNAVLPTAPGPAPASTARQFRLGGTLRLLHACCEMLPNQLDPSAPPTEEAAELLACCLVRSLYGYTGKPASEGGSQLQPDLALSFPDVTSDGLTWTIRLRRGLSYAPPYASTPIKSGDVERGIMRTLRTPMPDSNRLSQIRQWRARQGKLSVIVGADAFAAGDVDTVSGIERPDDYTLRLRLTQQAGDLPARLSGSDTAPIPPGADVGRLSDYGKYLVSSGPYMVAGSERRDVTKQVSAQLPAVGFRPGTVDAADAGKPLPLGLVLVRNPSWRREADSLRPAYPDRIEVRTMHTALEGAQLIDSGAADLFSSAGAAPQIPISQVLRYRSSANLRSRLHVSRLDFVSDLVLNLAAPPFDDVHVRRAVAWVVDRQRLLQLAGGPLVGAVATHLIPDGLLGGVLQTYDPFGSLKHRGDLSSARREMSASRYDHNHDGRCDVAVCRAIDTVAFSDDYVPAQAASVASDLRVIGLQLHVRTYSRASKKVFAYVGDPKAHVAMAVSIGFDKNSAFPDVAGMLRLFSGPVTNYNAAYSLAGATLLQLSAWGYGVRAVPSIAPDMGACEALRGLPQRDCWGRLDIRLTDTLALAVPLLFQNDVRATSARVQHYSFDQSRGLPAFDGISLAPGAL